MHICHINLASGFSGGERQTLQLIKEQIKNGYTLTVIANPKSLFYKEIEKLNCKLVAIKHYLLGHKHLLTKDCELVHVHEGRAIYWAYFQSVLFNTPYIVTRRIDNPLKKKWLANKAYSKASALVGLSDAIIDQLEKTYKDNQLFKIPSSPVIYPVDSLQVKSIKERFKDKFIVVQASNLLVHKGHNTTLEAAAILNDINKNIHFVILGDGPEREQLEEKAKKLSNVTLVGKQVDMGNWFAAANLFIHPSYSEGLGSVILEAIQAGLPVIGSDAGGIPDIIEDEVSGLLFKSSDSTALAKAIERVESSLSLQNKLKTGGKEKLKIFDISTTAKSYEAIYETI